jgi:hypothetical protein
MEHLSLSQTDYLPPPPRNPKNSTSGRQASVLHVRDSMTRSVTKTVSSKQTARYSAGLPGRTRAIGTKTGEREAEGGRMGEGRLIYTSRTLARSLARSRARARTHTHTRTVPRISQRLLGLIVAPPTRESLPSHCRARPSTLSICVKESCMCRSFEFQRINCVCVRLCVRVCACAHALTGTLSSSATRHVEPQYRQTSLTQILGVTIHLHVYVSVCVCVNIYACMLVNVCLRTRGRMRVCVCL